MVPLPVQDWFKEVALETTWDLSREAALFVMQCAIADVSKDFDFLRLTREFTKLTTHAVAKADGHVSDEEILEITYLADYFLLNVARVNQAFLKATS
jgi:hypothetical protein